MKTQGSIETYNASNKKHRKKLWEVSNLFHCSIIGTCLTMEELLRIFKKSGFHIPRDIRDYEIHGNAVNLAGKKDQFSKIMHKTLDNKFIHIIKQFSNAKTENELELLWDESVKRGNIPGPYWALMAHPSATQELRENTFGEVHMLSHLMGSSNQADKQRLQDLEKECCRLGESRRVYKSRIKEMEEHIKELETSNLRTKGIEQKLQKAYKLIFEYEDGRELSNLRKEVKELIKKFELEKERADKAERELNKLYKNLEDVLEENICLLEELDESKSECSAVEEELLAVLDHNIERHCENCTQRNDSCINLCDRMILYVGGRTSLIPHYKTIVEQNGGKFIHHDGGLEDAPSRLSDMLPHADAVICALDCVSHDACLRVKKSCKNYTKKLIMMRSSGLSSFARGLRELVSEYTQSQIGVV